MRLSDSSSREDKRPRGLRVKADGVRPGMTGQEVELVSSCLSGDGFSYPGWEEDTAKAQRHQTEDSSLRPLWQLTSILLKIKRQQRKIEAPENTVACHYVLETKWVSDEWRNHVKMYVIEINIVRLLWVAR